MNVIQIIYTYLIAVPVFLIIDLVWLGVIARGFYQTQLAGFLGPVNWPVAIVFYLLYVAGIVFFAVVPAFEAQSLSRALILGAALGFFAYMTYDLTNLSTLRDWPALLAVVDIAWGTVLTASVASVTYWIASKLIF